MCKLNIVTGGGGGVSAEALAPIQHMQSDKNACIHKKMSFNVNNGDLVHKATGTHDGDGIFPPDCC